MLRRTGTISHPCVSKVCFTAQRHLRSEISSYTVDPAAEVRLGGIATLPIQAYRDLVD